MIKNICLLYLLLISLSNYAQDSIKVSSNIFKLNILRTGLAYEKSVSKLSTINLDVNLTPFFIRTNSGFNAVFIPYVNGQYRHYYSLEKRLKKGKNISRNSANFLAIGTSYYFKSLGEKIYASFNDGFSTSAVWGLQRTYKSGINININTGIG